MNQNAKQFLTRISEKVSTLTDKTISQVAHAPKENEWRAYIWQRAPWEDIAWRIKEPNANGEAEVHLGFYSSKPGEGFSEGLDNAEQLAKGKVSHIVKNENGIRFVWNVNLSDTKGLKKVEDTILELLPEFIPLALSCVVKETKTSLAKTNEISIQSQDLSYSNPDFYTRLHALFFDYQKDALNLIKSNDNPKDLGLATLAYLEAIINKSEQHEDFLRDACEPLLEVYSEYLGDAYEYETGEDFDEDLNGEEVTFDMLKNFFFWEVPVFIRATHPSQCLKIVC
jgi:hypothetical protein